ncbi:MAG: alpha/beta fold hydrolase [Vicinamibacteria bacterium]|nr:alpha/beta fold hydrolase [Vicinamibacteria bacterium]
MPTTSRAGATIHYTMAGAGPPVLLIQGVGAIGRAWQPQIEAPASDHAVLAFDNRGIGASSPGAVPLSIEAMAADALAVADAAGAARLDVVGHSMGGVIAQQVALSAPSRVRSLSLLCTFARGAQGARLSWDLLVAGLRSRIGPRSARRRAFVELVMTREYLVRADLGRPRGDTCRPVRSRPGRSAADRHGAAQGHGPLRRAGPPCLPRVDSDTGRERGAGPHRAAGVRTAARRRHPRGALHRDRGGRSRRADSVRRPDQPAARRALQLASQPSTELGPQPRASGALHSNAAHARAVRLRAGDCDDPTSAHIESTPSPRQTAAAIEASGNRVVGIISFLARGSPRTCGRRPTTSQTWRLSRVM